MAQARPRKKSKPLIPLVRGPHGQTRQRLLDATLEYLRQRGMGDITLRQLADALGTSHRVLIYHFKTKEGLLVAIAEEIEREQRSWLRSLSERNLTPMQQMQSSWHRISDPQLDPHFRLFIEIYGHALQGREHTAPLLETLVHAWLGPMKDLFMRMGLPASEARIHARLCLATARGLMLDLLTTGDTKATHEAWKHYISQYDALPRAHRPV